MYDNDLNSTYFPDGLGVGNEPGNRVKGLLVRKEGVRDDSILVSIRSITPCRVLNKDNRKGATVP